jgi:hypothetical protein
MMSKVMRRTSFVFAAVVLASLIGCGGGDEEKGNTTKDESISKRIVGNWQGNPDFDDAAFEAYMNERNMPEELKREMKKSIEESTFLFSFQEDGTGKAGMNENGSVRFDDVEWKVENESGDKAQIAIKDSVSKDGKLDVTFQEDGSIIAKLVPPEEERNSLPDFTIHLKKVDELPKETKANPMFKTMPAKTPDRPGEKAPE